ncbi:TrkA C-terminal domain-containing protein [Halobaculum magnesiiphilum]|uniref:TrkA C-terminal domain-containing protein n=1 Tax=Halobaculum magnesiiphilum TaxID=1017351 RepID=A0A8T8WCV7_9EURY|nr:TrkA C-terminal domain-containing protein [Halobaculum magnesiiphilum]QZP37574.1 TrkA C-terminal domain-containing protein [Halobaculum magnesiiphilum]
MVDSSLPVQVLLGVYLGLLTGIVPALVAWTLGFTFKYVTGVSIPGFGVVVLSLAIAGVNGGLLALNDETITEATNGTAFLVAIVVILMISMYAHAKGDAMGAALPKRISLSQLTERTLSSEAVDLASGRGRVRVTVAGDVADIEGYPPLPPELRAELRSFEEDFDADLPLSELETAVADRLRSDHDLAEVTVRLDERGRATVAAAPPLAGVSKRVPAGKQAVSVSALLPTGLARGDEVTVVTADRAVDGTVVAAKTDGGGTAKPSKPPATDGGEDAPRPPASPTTTGGDGRLTVAVDRGAATRLLDADVERVVVRSRGTRREFELLSLLRRAGKRFRRLSVRAGGPLDGTSLRGAAVRDEYGVAVLAINDGGRWRLAPGGDTVPAAGADLLAVGTRRDLDRFEREVGA